MLNFPKNIVLGVTGSIAAYKSAELVRCLREMEVNVRVVMTAGAQEFMTALTLQTLSHHPVHTHLLDPAAEMAMSHIELARWADLVLIAPASADVIACLAVGRADDLLTTLCLATAAPLMIAPAMNQQMWQHSATQNNCQVLQQRGVKFLGPASGDQACGEVGMGRMLAPADILAALGCDELPFSLQGQHVVVTAGPTRESIDPVRYISNHSSGKMGYAVAIAAAIAGARVTLISGPVNLPAPSTVERLSVETAAQMHEAVMRAQPCDIFIGTAAVADYRVADMRTQKLKKSTTPLTLQLTPNPDILRAVSTLPARPFVVGFAAETEHVIANARAKLKRKQLDVIVANQVGAEYGGFNADDNAVTIITANTEVPLALASKQIIAQKLIHFIARRMTCELSK